MLVGDDSATHIFMTPINSSLFRPDVDMRGDTRGGDGTSCPTLSRPDRSNGRECDVPRTKSRAPRR